MKVRFISAEEVTVDLPIEDFRLIDAAVTDQAAEHGIESPRLDDIIRQFNALRVLIKAHTEGFPG